MKHSVSIGIWQGERKGPLHTQQRTHTHTQSKKTGCSEHGEGDTWVTHEEVETGLLNADVGLEPEEDDRFELRVLRQLSLDLCTMCMLTPVSPSTPPIQGQPQLN